MKIDVLFIHPGNHRKSYQDLANEFTAIAPPVWTSLLAEFVRQKGHGVRIYDANIEGWSREKAVDLLSRLAPNLIVLFVYGHNPSASTQTMPAALKIALDLKDIVRDIPIAIGGLHPTALPERTLVESSVDYIIKGEGAITIHDILKYQKGKKDINSVRGICFHDKKRSIVQTAPAVNKEQLDVIYPGYAWDLLPDLGKYRAHNSHTLQYFEESKKEDFSDIRSPYAVMYTSLGCPYTCSFCCINSLFGRPGIRYWSVEKVLESIDCLVREHQIKNLRLDDELFVLDRKRVEAICDRLIERKYSLNLWAYARVDTVDVALLKKMKEAGFSWLCLGIEAAEKSVREGVNKHIGKDVVKTVRSIQENGIYVLGNFMFGLPSDDFDSMKSTLSLARELNCEFANFYCTMAYPGSKLYDNWMQLNKQVIPDDWNSFSQHSFTTQPLPTKYLSPSEVLRFRDDAFLDYFTNDNYLRSIREKFGNKAVSHINRMTSLNLKRKLLEHTD